ncbi:MAG: 2TM domain-containing protein [Eudoraea sp.]|nr:2TM domain-containing protein [Eudoraea sp.]MBT8322421.1 2TM domain-containing protein [Eudoraea sp.]NNJ41230.1 2TM domain-containing protein [Eudoraea sp.]
MTTENKQDRKIPLEQHDQLEYAQKRILQKKRLYRHFVFFLVGAVFLVILNKVLKYGEAYDWYLWGILLWLFLLLLHTVNVFILHPFMGQEWERSQRERLVQKQRQRISELQKEMEADFPLATKPKKKT